MSTETMTVEQAAEAIGAVEETEVIEQDAPEFAEDAPEEEQAEAEEIAEEAHEAFLEAGGEEFRYIDCLNARPDWIAALSGVAERHLQGWDTHSAPDAAALQAQRERAVALGAAA